MALFHNKKMTSLSILVNDLNNVIHENDTDIHNVLKSDILKNANKVVNQIVETSNEYQTVVDYMKKHLKCQDMISLIVDACENNKKFKLLCDLNLKLKLRVAPSYNSSILVKDSTINKHVDEITNIILSMNEHKSCELNNCSVDKIVQMLQNKSDEEIVYWIYIIIQIHKINKIFIMYTFFDQYFVNLICRALELLYQKKFYTECLAIMYIIYIYFDLTVTKQICIQFPSSFESKNIKSEFVNSISKVALYDLIYVISRFTAEFTNKSHLENYAHEKNFKISIVECILSMFSDENRLYDIKKTEYDYRNGLRAAKTHYHYDVPLRKIRIVVDKENVSGNFETYGIFYFCYDKNVIYRDMHYLAGMSTLSLETFKEEGELYDITYGNYCKSRDYYAHIDDYKTFSFFRFNRAF